MRSTAVNYRQRNQRIEEANRFSLNPNFTLPLPGRGTVQEIFEEPRRTRNGALQDEALDDVNQIKLINIVSQQRP